MHQDDLVLRLTVELLNMSEYLFGGGALNVPKLIVDVAQHLLESKQTAGEEQLTSPDSHLTANGAVGSGSEVQFNTEQWAEVSQLSISIVYYIISGP